MTEHLEQLAAGGRHEQAARAGGEGAANGATPPPASAAALADTAGATGSSQRIALLVDSKLAACLMMSNLADELKQHAVTLYEVGKIPHEALDTFLQAMAAVERPPIDEADVLEYFDHAIALRYALIFLRANDACKVDDSARPLDIVRTESLATLDAVTRNRVLHRSYALLISMAPMVPICENVYTADLPVAHFGPTYAILTSAWLQLTLYAALGRGPASILLPRGSRLRMVPHALRGCTHILLSPWGEQPIVCAISSLLSVSSELLLRVPLLMQEYVEDAARLTLQLAMPLAGTPVAAPTGAGGDAAGAVEGRDGGTADERSDSAGTGAGAGEDGAGGEDMGVEGAGGTPRMAGLGAAEHGMAAAQGVAVELMHELGLGHSIGLIQLLRRPARSDGGELRKGGRVGEDPSGWVPLTVHFGLPLSDVPACKAVCEQIEARGLFTNASLAAHTRAMRALRDRVREFMAAHAANDSDGHDGAGDETGDCGAYPCVPLLFDGERVSRFETVNELYLDRERARTDSAPDAVMDAALGQGQGSTYI